MHAALVASGAGEIEVNPLLLTPQRAWVLDGLARA
jgi:hypothetical protein